MNWTPYKIDMKLIGKIYVVMFAWGLFLGSIALAAEPAAYEINGFYLGSRARDFGVTFDTSKHFPDDKYYEAESKGVRLFYVRIKKEFRLYRIIKEQKITPDRINATLKKLIKKYGTPDKQQIKTVSVRPKNQRKYNTAAKNKAFWNINETQDFIVEIESKRVVYELVDKDPEKIMTAKKPAPGEEGFTVDEGWDPDY